MKTRVYLSEFDIPTRELYEFARAIPESENGFTNPFRHLFNYEEFKIALELLLRDAEFDPTDLHYEGRVPQLYYWVRTEEGEVIGIAKTRFLLTGRLLRNGGHIGLWLKPEARGQGYGVSTIKELLRIEKEHDVRDIWVTVRANNLSARRTVERVGGKLIDELPAYPTDTTMCRYLVAL